VAAFMAPYACYSGFDRLIRHPGTTGALTTGGIKSVAGPVGALCRG
jgi:hypothetical protein